MGRPKKLWSIRVGARGNSVVAYERKLGGTLWLRWWASPTPTAAGHFVYRSLRHTDRDAAEESARAIAAALMQSVVNDALGRASIAEIFAAYRADVADHTKGQGPKEAKRRIAVWTTFLGANRDIATIDHPTIDRYVRERRDGAIQVKGHKLKKRVSDGAIGSDIVFLNAAINHGTKVSRSNGTKLVAVNPLRGYPIPQNKNKRRPVATFDRFIAVTAKADEADPQSLFGPFMALIEGLGWRVTAVCSIRASEVDLKVSAACPFGRIYKNPRVDKEGEGGWLPMSQAVRQAVERALAVNPAIGDAPLFPAPKARVRVQRVAEVVAHPMIRPETSEAVSSPAEAPKSWTRFHARTLLRRAEKLAGLVEIAGGDFHPYRRKWATERKHLAPQDVAKAGGWSDLETLQRAYQQVDEETMYAVVSEPRKLREIKMDEATG